MASAYVIMILILVGCNEDEGVLTENENITDALEWDHRQDVSSMPDWVDDAVIYEVNVRQYTNEGTFKSFAKHLPRLQELGVDILWFMPIHPISETRRLGTLGSYYSVQDYTAVNPEFGTMEDFQYLVEMAHEMGFYVLLDWVANHTGWDHAWVEKNPNWYKQDTDGEIIHPQTPYFEWTDVAQLDYENKSMRREMKDAMLFWVEEIGVDGFRADYASGPPVDFWENISDELSEIKPVFMLAEDDSVFRLLHEAFHANWGWEFHHIMNNIANGMKNRDHVRYYFEQTISQYPEGTFPMHFIDSHDENSWEGTIDERLGEATEAMATLYFTVPGIPMIYSGQEAGLDHRLAFFEKDEIDWSDLSRQSFYEDLIQLKKNNPALWNGVAGGDIHFFETSDPALLAFKRNKETNTIIVLINLSADEISETIEFGAGKDGFLTYPDDDPVFLDSKETIHFEAWEYKILYKE